MSAAAGRHPVRVGVLLWPQGIDWPELRDAAVLADAVGLDSLWTWDHLHAIVGDPDQPIYEGWTTIAALGALTRRATVGLMVGANTFRNPGLTAKMAATVDHITDGRAWLGIGGAWFEHEHARHGIDFGSGFGERLDRLDEAVAAMRGLLRGEAVTSPPGGAYRFDSLRHAPLPVRGPGRLPIMVGGGGEKKTLRTVARYADGWNVGGSLETMRRKVDILAGYCGEIGRDLAGIEFTLFPYCVIRDDPEEARRHLVASLARHGETYEENPGMDMLGPEEAVAEAWRPYLELGFTHLIPDLAGPFDRETIERLPEVRRLVAGS
ncbi:MAG: LLM class flavin-dependent oxidoreductase [Chloroflexi bacterium]|nr:LLM class flavin-dependent oxidoreductase [Chloroflexota bacterium]